MTDTNYIKKNQRLPEEISVHFKMIASDNAKRDQLIRELVKASWTYEAVSNASDLTRERVRQIANASSALAAEFQTTIDIEIPEPPVKSERAKREYTEPSPETLARLLELKPYAELVRANGKRYREEGEEYTRLINYSRTVEGVPIYRIALRLGVTHSAVRSRLTRYGYITPKTGKSKVYQPIIQANRAVIA